MAHKQGYGALAPYLRELVARGLKEDMHANPGMFLSLRPGSTVFKPLLTGGYTPLAQGIGGERVWVIAVEKNLPSSMGGGLGYICDITAGNTRGGLEGRGVVVRVSDVVGT